MFLPIHKCTSSLSRFAYKAGHGSVSKVFGYGRPMSSSAVYNLSDETAVDKFQRMNGKSILYFTATWCPPCKMIKPVYESMASEYPEIAFGKVDVDDNAEAASTYEITGVPTFILFQQDKVFKRFTGADQNQLKQSLASLQDAA